MMIHCRAGGERAGCFRALPPAFLFFLVTVLAGIPAAAASPLSASPERELTLTEAILLAVQNNRDLAAGRLDRLAQKLSLQDSEDEFRLTPAFDVSFDSDSTDAPVDWEAVSLGVSPRVTLRIPTGGQLSLSANNRITNQGDESQFVTLTFAQPLLKGGGTAVGTANLVTARRLEQIGFLGFKSAVMGIVTQTIYAYRNLIRSMQAVEISERSLQRARDLLAVNRALIDTGRMAEHEIIQSEANIAERELSLTETRDALDDARLALIDILEIDSRTQIRPTETLRVDPKKPDADQGVELALQHRPDYLQSQLSMEIAETALLVADNARWWELNLTSSANFMNSGHSLSNAYSRFDDDYSIGLNLSIPLGVTADSLRRDQRRARFSLQRSRLRLAELRQSIDIQVRAAVRDVEVQSRRAELARQARELAERKLEIENVKLNSGLTTNFRLVEFEDDLVRSQNSEIGAIVSYLNALTALDRIQGTTLDTWNIGADLPDDEMEDE